MGSLGISKTEWANVVRGVGDDYARALGFKGGSDSGLGKGREVSYANVLGQQNVPWTTFKNVQTAKGRASIDPNDPIGLDVTKPVYEQKPITEQVPRVWAEAQLKTQKEAQDIENQQQDIIKKKMENEFLISDIDSRSKASSLLDQDVVRHGVDSALGKTAKLISTVVKNKMVNPLDGIKFYQDILKGNQTRINGIYMFKTALKINKGIDIDNPAVMKEIEDINSPTSQAVAEYLHIATKESKFYDDNVTGIRQFYIDLGGGNMQKTVSVKMNLSTDEKQKQEKEKITYAAQQNARFREPKETEAQKLDFIEKSEKLKIKINAGKPLTPSENNARIAESNRLIKTIEEEGEAQQVIVFKQWYEINPTATSVIYLKDGAVTHVALPKKNGVQGIAKDILEYANFHGLTISQSLRRLGIVK